MHPVTVFIERFRAAVSVFIGPCCPALLESYLRKCTYCCIIDKIKWWWWWWWWWLRFEPRPFTPESSTLTTRLPSHRVHDFNKLLVSWDRPLWLLLLLVECREKKSRNKLLHDDRVKALRPSRHEIGHFGGVLRSRCFGLVLRKK